MAREQYFTISQLKSKDTDYVIIDSDALLGTIGTATAELSSAKISFQQFGKYLISTFPARTTFNIAGSLSASGGLSANGGLNNVITLQDLPTTATSLKTGDLFTQTATQLGGSGTTKVLCVK